MIFVNQEKNKITEAANFTRKISRKITFCWLLRPRFHATNTQRIAVYPGKFKFILVKISPNSERLHGRHAKENQTPITVFTAGNLSGLSCLQESAIRSILILVQLCCEFTQVNAFTLWHERIETYLANIYPFFLRINFYPD